MDIKPNNIYLGNAYEMIKDMPDKSVDLIVTDPPYDIEGIHGSGILKTRGHTPSFHKELAENKLDKGIDLKILDDFVRVMKKINIYIWCNKNQIYDYMTYFVKERNCSFEMLIWAKENPIPFCGTHYLVDKEYCLYFWEQGAPINIPYERARTYYISKTNTMDKKDYGHPTIKSIDFIDMLVKNSMPAGGGVIFDPFAGSGTHLLAGKRNGMQYIGFEINPKYYQICCDRLKGINARGEMNLFDIDYEE